MELTRIRNYAHKHCRFKLRSGKEIFGVIWEVETTDKSGQAGTTQKLFFASVGDYERAQHDPGKPIEVIPMQPEEIVQVESLAS